MRWLLIIGTIVTGARLLAAPGLEDRSATPSLDPVEAGNYGRQINHLIAMIAAQYVKPVERTDLAAAALHGLYEAARVSPPSALADDLRKARDDEELIALFTQARLTLGDRDDLKGPQALLSSLKALSGLLDPYSGVVSSMEWSRGDEAESGPSLGMQVKDNLGVGPLVVQTVIPGGPAQRAGIRPGDQITSIDGREVASLNVSAPALLRRTSGTPDMEVSARPLRVQLAVTRPGSSSTRKVALEEQTFRGETVLGVIRQDDNHWDYWIDRGRKVAHVRIGALGHGTSTDLAETIVDLEAQGMRGLILDLRWCPGGFLNEAVNIAQIFVGDTRVASVRGRDGKEIEYGSAKQPRKGSFPLIVLVNGDTSGGAELIAAAIQDTRRGLVAGQRTLGKASVQTPIDLPLPNTKFKITTGTFFRPSGKNLHRFSDSKPTDDWGVRPERDLEYRVSADLGRRLRDWWLLQSLRPGIANDALPLDDPAVDTQRQAALQALVARIKE